MATTNNHQIFASIQNLLIKVCLNLSDIITFKGGKDIPEGGYGQALNRCLLLATARAVKLRGLADYSRQSDLHAFVTRLVEITGATLSQSIYQYFPAVMRKTLANLYQFMHKPAAIATRARVNEYCQQHKAYLMQANNTITALRPFYQQQQRHLFLCVVWHIRYEFGQAQSMLPNEFISYVIPSH